MGSNPLKHVGKVNNYAAGSFRRALSLDEINRLLVEAPRHRARVYLVALYTGLRRAELNGLKWADFDLDASPAVMRVPSSISKNRKATSHALRPELVAVLKEHRAADALRGEHPFRGGVPRVATFKKDLAAASIPFIDTTGRRIDLHGLRHTFITLCSESDIAPRKTMALARQSDLKLTMKFYTDTERLNLQGATALLPSFSLPVYDAPGAAPAGVISRLSASQAVVPGQQGNFTQVVELVKVIRREATRVAPSRSGKMVGLVRFELTTSCTPCKRATRLRYSPNK